MSFRTCWHSSRPIRPVNFLSVRRQVSIEEAEKFAQDNRIALTFETSSKNDINVKALFEEIAKQVFVGYLSKRRQS